MTIRPMQREDLGAVAALYEQVVRSGEAPAAELRGWFERALFEHPWVDSEIPSLVALGEDGGLDGFLASHVRRLRIDDRPARLACSGQLVSAPRARRRATGALLLRTYLGGPQDLTITDGATEPVRAMWERLGGELAHPQSIEWWLPLRPGSLAAAWWARRRGRGAPVGTAGRRRAPCRRGPPGPPLRRLARAGGDPEAEATAERYGELRTDPLSAESLVDELPGLTARLRLYPDYDAAFAGWLLDELRAAREGLSWRPWMPGSAFAGELRARLVRDAGDRTLGWFIYYLVEAGPCAVISIAAPDEPSSGAVLDALLEDARAGGGAALHGRLEPRIVAPAAARGCLLRYAGRALVARRRPGGRRARGLAPRAAHPPRGRVVDESAPALGQGGSVAAGELGFEAFAQRAAVDLAVLVLRQLGEGPPAGRQHVGGQRAGERRAQVHMGQLRLARHVGAADRCRLEPLRGDRDDGAFAERGERVQRRLDLTQLDPVAAVLDLRVDTADVAKQPVLVDPAEVAGRVDPALRRGGRRRRRPGSSPRRASSPG